MSNVNPVGRIKYSHTHSVAKESNKKEPFKGFFQVIKTNNALYNTYQSSSSLKGRAKVLTKAPLNNKISISNNKKLPKNRA
ncbi:MAG: hypothetical protein A3F40_02515 [Chlamydiae bacterium RIFCSPHIGHO2_12_FULL_27_8]|nr:MAG: hypothetical protein A3F40_02515 [Chlamydiae bacterium RIFCSPHIGHO2_12_FULL_27_8]OGN64997.1 MAG: hypothetical protein A2888_02060 [Chlamydiae bacterium RIFCSPLOWO2_01_FULL_28_7]